MSPDEPEPDEAEITEEMIEAGVDAACGEGVEIDVRGTYAELAIKVYRAMHAARAKGKGG
jgi:hypothetical protein